MEPVDHLIAVWRGWIIIAVMTGVGLVGGLLAGFVEAPSYRTTSSVLLVPSSEGQNTDIGELGNFMRGQVHSYAELATAPIVLDPVAGETGLAGNADGLAGRIEVEVPIDTLVIEVSAADSDPVQAADLANSTVRHLQAAVADVAPRGGSAAPTVELKTVGQAEPPTFPESPRKALRLVIGTGLGMFLGVLIAIALHAVRMRRDSESGNAP